MALTCPTSLTAFDVGFTEFIDCDTISISYDILGIANVSFTVISISATPINPSQYTQLTFGGITFTGFISNLEIRRIEGSSVYQHSYTISGVGCRV